MSELVLVANAGDGTISTLRLDAGRLTPLATSPIGKGVGTFAVDAGRDLVFAGVKAEDDAPPAIVTLDLDRGTGALTERSRRAVDDSMTYLSLTDDGETLLGASYGGGFGARWPVAEDGAVGEPTARLEHPNLHCVVTEGDLAWFVSLGADLVDQRRLGPTGSLEPLGEVHLPPGSGPRHLVLEGANGYLVTEYSGEVYHLRRGADGLLELSDDVSIVDPSAGLGHSRMGADPREERLVWGADVHLAGAFLLASERTASTIAVVPVAGDGTLGEVVSLTETRRQPRGFAVAADGRHAIVVGELDIAAEVLRVNDDGTLTRTDLVEVGHGANWVRLLQD